MVNINTDPEKKLRISLNLHKEPVLLNRLRKFLMHPFKYLSYLTYKFGISKRAERKALTCFGSQMILPLWDQNAVILYFTGTLAPEELAITRYLIRTLGKGDVFYDIGANLGYFSSLASMIGAQVYSFEPNQRMLPFLEKNGNGSIHIEQVAISDENGEASFYDMSESGKSGTSSLIKPRHPAKTMSVKTVALDTFSERAAIPTVIKIDVEGAEASVLTGAKHLIQTVHPTIIMEVLGGDKKENSQTAISLLKSYGYTSYQINPDGSLVTPVSETLNLVFKM